MEPITIEVQDDAADASEVDSAARVLWSELARINDLNVDAKSDAAPLSAKSPTAGALTTLAVILGSHGVVAFANVLKDWLTRHRTFKIKLKKGSNVIEISGVNPADVSSLLPKVERLLK